MIKLILEKELREVLGSPKFFATFAVCSILILLTFYVGAQNYLLSKQQHQAAKAENFRQMQGFTSWEEVRGHSVFLPPQPLETLVAGVSNDIGRTVEVAGRGELAATGSRYGSDPLFAVFRFLDLDFIFQVVLSLFAILFAFNALSGEKESGTLKLTFANSVPPEQYIVGKLTGLFCALAVPLLIPILLGCLLLPILGVNLDSSEWGRLALVVGAGLLYFGAFLGISVLVSSMTEKSANSFLMLLVVWIFSVLIIPRTAVLLAGRTVEVANLTEINSQKSRLGAQLWREDRERMADFKPSQNNDPQVMMKEFNDFMTTIADERDEKMSALAKKLNSERYNGQRLQQQLAFGISRISPTASFSLAAAKLSGTSIFQANDYIRQVNNYQRAYASFMIEKTGTTSDGRQMRMVGGEDDDPIDPRELPEFTYQKIGFSEALNRAVPDLAVLALFNIFSFAGAFFRFKKYDVR